jgi:hypothetical protein
MGAAVSPILTLAQINAEFGLLWFESYHSAAEIQDSVRRCGAPGCDLSPPLIDERQELRFPCPSIDLAESLYTDPRAHTV